jgi:hypothetical protein
MVTKIVLDGRWCFVLLRPHILIHRHSHPSAELVERIKDLELYSVCRASSCVIHDTSCTHRTLNVQSFRCGRRARTRKRTG